MLQLLASWHTTFIAEHAEALHSGMTLKTSLTKLHTPWSEQVLRYKVPYLKRK